MAGEQPAFDRGALRIGALVAGCRFTAQACATSNSIISPISTKARLEPNGQSRADRN